MIEEKRLCILTEKTNNSFGVKACATQMAHGKTSQYHCIEQHKSNFFGVGCDAAMIGIKTQIRRFVRFLVWLLTFGQCNIFKYFAKEEKDNNIYQNDQIDLKSDAIHNLGHATQLITIDGYTIITDPVFHDLNSFLYPAKTKAGIDITTLKDNIDIILISHNHRDHVDEKSLKELLKQNPNVHVLIPSGDRKLFHSFGFTNITEVAWGDNIKISQQDKEAKEAINIIGVAADHWSGRGVGDAHGAATNGYIISSQTALHYIAGDTAKLTAERIAEIASIMSSEGKKDKPITMIMPDGPNYDRNSMESTHMSVLESIIVVLDTIVQFSQKSHNNSPDMRAELLKKLDIVLYHPNKFELGPDQFNQGLHILNKVQEAFKNKNLAEITKTFEAKSKYKWFSSNRDNFVYKQTLEILSKLEAFKTKEDELSVVDLMIELIKKVKNPKIGERVTHSQRVKNKQCNNLQI